MKSLCSMVALATMLGPVVGCGTSSDEGGTGGTAGDGGMPPVVLDGGGTIPDPPDGAAACQLGTCNYQAQDCPGGASCLPTDTPPATGEWPPKCFTAGSGAPGESCSAWNECTAGHFCVGISGTADGGVKPGTCRKLCCGRDWSACPSGESCFQQLYLQPSGGEPVYAKADVCAPVGGCDPLAPGSCPSGKACQLVDPTGNVACVTAGTAGAGEACSASESCKAGFTCVAEQCRRLCKAVEGGGEPSCPSSEGVCVHYDRDPAGVGECTVL